MSKTIDKQELKAAARYLESHFPTPISDAKWARAYRLAIETLLNYPTTDGDTISRQAAIDAVCGDFRTLFRAGGREEVGEILKSLPSTEPVQPQGG